MKPLLRDIAPKVEGDRVARMGDAEGANPRRRCPNLSGGPNVAKRTCSIEGCEKKHLARGLCATHYHRWERYGDPLSGRPLRFPWPDNLLRRMEPQPNGCIYYTGDTNNHGYGRLARDGVTVQAHRAAYEYFVGPIPEGMVVDHECHNSDASCPGGACPHRRCVNWEHLAPKTGAANIAASPRSNVSKTHCVHGHEFTEENTRMRSDGSRRCLRCQAASNAKRRAS